MMGDNKSPKKGTLIPDLIFSLIKLFLLSVMKKHECKTIVFSSTAMVYKPDLNKKLDEKSFISPPIS